MVDNAMRRVIHLFGEARAQVRVVSAFIRSDVLHELLAAVPDNVPVTVYTRWHIEDILSGASDKNAWDVAKKHGAEFYACPRLHAKMYIADNAALVGSANATHKGFRGSGSSNIELLLPADVTQKDICETLNTIFQMSFLAAPFGIDVREHGLNEDVVITPCIWIPGTDYESFINITQGVSPHTEDSRNDCQALGLSEIADRNAIRTAVRDTTVFRVIEDIFNTWPGPMNHNELRKMFTAKRLLLPDPLPEERLSYLMTWVGRMGKNTFLIEGSDKNTPTLYPGKLLSSHIL